MTTAYGWLAPSNRLFLFPRFRFLIPDFSALSATDRNPGSTAFRQVPTSHNLGTSSYAYYLRSEMHYGNQDPGVGIKSKPATRQSCNVTGAAVAKRTGRAISRWYVSCRARSLQAW
jgi:hypothetical protein